MRLFLAWSEFEFVSSNACHVQRFAFCDLVEMDLVSGALQ